MISGADQDFRIISRMMAQIKAVGALQSRRVYGFYLLWKKRLRGGRRKKELNGRKRGQ